MKFPGKGIALTVIVSAIALLGSNGCKRSSAAPVASPPTSSKEYEIGDLDKNGNTVIFAVGDRYRVLETEAALVFRNIGTDTEPQVRFDLTTRGGGHRAYPSIRELIDELAKMPEPRVVDFYGTCGGPPWYGIPEAEVGAFFRAMEEAMVELRELRPDGIINSICTCPDLNE